MFTISSYDSLNVFVEFDLELYNARNSILKFVEFDIALVWFAEFDTV